MQAVKMGQLVGHAVCQDGVLLSDVSVGHGCRLDADLRVYIDDLADTDALWPKIEQDTQGLHL